MPMAPASRTLMEGWIDRVLSDVKDELLAAYEKHPGRQASLHEGYAVLLEEVDELWDEVKKKASKRDLVKVRDEARQIAAMAVRLIVDGRA